MAFADGDPFISGTLLSYQQANRMKDHWCAAAAPTNPQGGMLYSNSADDVLKHYGANTAAWLELLQAGIPFNDDNQVVIPICADDETKTDNYNVLVTDFGKTFIMNGINKTFNLPSVALADVGAILTFVFISTGTLIIDAADNDTIDDSGAGDTIYCTQNGEKYSSITLMLASTTEWIILAAKGIWTTTD